MICLRSICDAIELNEAEVISYMSFSFLGCRGCISPDNESFKNTSMTNSAKTVLSVESSADEHLQGVRPVLPAPTICLKDVILAVIYLSSVEATDSQTRVYQSCISNL